MTYALPVVATSFACMAAWLGLALHDVVQQGKLHPAPCDADAVGRSSGAVGVTRTKLGLARLFWLAFGVFFVLYHLCYENILHHTDGMEYLSDWTFVLLAIVMGLLAFHSLGKTPTSGGDASGGGDAHHERLAEFTVALHGVCWSSNIVSTAGAWYSFFFFPVCESLEEPLPPGVNNYPWCYLEWYRLTEHGLNMLILFGDYAAGAVPVRRKDLGWSVIFLQCYAVYTWYLMYTTGKCAYIMFDFSTGWASVAWLNAAFAGIAVRGEGTQLSKVVYKTK